MEYRQQFEKSQQVRIQAKVKKFEDENTGAGALDNITDVISAVDSDDELGHTLGIPYLKFEVLDPR